MIQGSGVFLSLPVPRCPFLLELVMRPRLVDPLLIALGGLCIWRVRAATPTPAVLLLDSFSETLSGYAKAYCRDRGIVVVEAVTPYSQAMLAARGAEVPDALKTPLPGEEPTWAETLLPEDAEIKCCISESDAGVPTAERISLALHLPTNGHSEHLRNKYLTNMRLRQAGMNAASQILSAEWDVIKKEVQKPPFQSAGGHLKCVVKPYRGVASDGVHLCNSLEEVYAAFHRLFNSSKYGGGRLDQVLVQEYLDGEEFAVDTVSSNGCTKITAVWRYRKLPMNNAPFVYQCSVRGCRCDSRFGHRGRVGAD